MATRFLRACGAGAGLGTALAAAAGGGADGVCEWLGLARTRLRESRAAKDSELVHGAVVVCLIQPKSVSPLATNCTASATSSRPISRVMIRIPVLPRYRRTRSAPERTQ